VPADLTDVYSALQKADAAGDTESAQQLADYIRTSSAAPAPPQSDDTDVGRQVALQGRAAAQGVVGALTLPQTAMTGAFNLPRWIANKFGGHYGYLPTPAGVLSKGLTAAGAPEPETSGEQLASAATSGVTGGLAAGGLGGATSIANAVRSGAAGLSGGVSQETARQVGLPWWAQIGAGVLGSQAPAMGESFARTAGDLTAPVTKAGQVRAAGTLLNNQASDPQAALARLKQAAPTVPNSEPTTGAVSKDPGLLSVEKALRGTSSADFGARTSAQNAARQAELTDIGGTPQDLQNAIDARSRASAPLYAAAATHSAPLDNELTALMQRPAMQSAIKQAQDLQANRGQTFGLQTNMPGAPMAITGSDAQAIKMALDDMRTSGKAQGIGSHQVRALQGTLDDFNDWTSRNIPAQKAADATYQQYSAPVNKMQTVQDLQQKASTTAADPTTGHYFLGPSQYSNALDKVLADPQNGLGKMDIARLEGIRKDLEASQAVNGPMLKAPGSDTFQNLSLNQNIGGWPGSVVSKAFGPAYKFAGADTAINKLLTQAMLDPKTAAGLMQAAQKPKGQLNFRPFDLGTAGGLLGSSP
jgi:hypothetical protein